MQKQTPKPDVAAHVQNKNNTAGNIDTFPV
jgi:hypothetical protein